MQTGDKIPFAKRILFSHECPPNLPEHIEFRKIDKLDSIREYSTFILAKFWQHIETPYVLTVQTDGCILRPELWRDEWLQYDYIGAPWPADKIWAAKTQVGNSGLCLRSKSFLIAAAKIFEDSRTDLDGIRGYYAWSDDVFACYVAYDKIVGCGLKFATLDEARQFSYEDDCPNAPQTIDSVFGFHGRFTDTTNRLCELLRSHVTGRKLRLIVNYYNDPHYPRAIELDECLRANCGSGLFDEVILLAANETHVPFCRRVHRVWSQKRPTFTDHIEWANRCTKPNDINIMANADIQFDPETIQMFWQLRPSEFWALSRWENSSSPSNSPGDYRWCQDTWAWRGGCRIDLSKSGFPLGYPGCENRIAFLAHKAGYRVCNPSPSVKTFHIHDSGFRRYPATDHAVKCPDRIRPPYLYVTPHDIRELSDTEVDVNGPPLADKEPSLSPLSMNGNA